MQQSSASSSALPTECITKIDDRLGQVELFSVQGLAALRGSRDNLESKKQKLSPENNTKPTKNVIRSSQSKQETTKNGRVGQPSLPGSMFPNERFMGQSWLQSNPILAQALLNQTALEAGMTSILAQNFRVNGVVSLNVPARNVDETSPVSRCMESRNMGVGVQGISNKNTDSSNACDDKK
mmetsp:Transcript_27284/g.38586  ORF Transcript_27284/g.38586 Transcript_27284/m.38586 type:complete len:181 (+) Transcript_27284:698-1240(+)